MEARRGGEAGSLISSSLTPSATKLEIVMIKRHCVRNNVEKSTLSRKERGLKLKKLKNLKKRRRKLAVQYVVLFYKVM